MTADPTGFDRLVIGDATTAPEPTTLHETVVAVLLAEGAGAGSSIHGWRCEYPDRYGPCDCVAEAASTVVEALRPWLADLNAADLAAVLVTNEGLRRENEQLRADLAAARRQAAELDERLTRMTRESAARDRVAPMTAWPQED